MIEVTIIIAIIAAISTLLNVIQFRKFSFGCFSCLNSACLCGKQETNEDGTVKDSPIVKMIRRVTGSKPKQGPIKMVPIKRTVKKQSPIMKAIRRIRGDIPAKKMAELRSYDREFL